MTGPDRPAEIPTAILAGDRVTLVPVRREDVGRLAGGDAGGRPIAPGWPHDDTQPGLSFALGGGWTWLICDEHGRVVGECGVKAAPAADGSVEIGYGLAGPSRGRGVGTRAVATLLRALQATPGVRRVEAEVHVANTVSRRLLERAGFAPVGSVSPGSGEVDQVRYALDLDVG